MNRIPDSLDTVWRDILSLPYEVKPNFKACYYLPIRKREGDLQWRLMHGAYATGTFLHNARFTLNPECPFCHVKDSLLHIFLECNHVQPLLTYLTQLTSRLMQPDATVPVYWYFINPPARTHAFADQRTLTLFVYLTSTAKYSIHTCRTVRIQCNEITNPLEIFKTRIRDRLRTEFEYYKLNQHLAPFINTWTINDIICSVNDNELDIVI